jgi:GNAT superfamily N-acetyltransferase
MTDNNERATNQTTQTENLDDEDDTRVTPVFIRAADVSLANAQNEIARLNFKQAAKHLDKVERKLTSANERVIEAEVQKMLAKHYYGDEGQCRRRLQSLVDRRWRVLREHRTSMESRLHLAPLVQSTGPVPVGLWYLDFGLTCPSRVCPTDTNLYSTAKLVCLQCGVDPLSPSSAEQHLVNSQHHQNGTGAIAPRIQASLDCVHPRHMLLMLGNSIAGYACWQSVLPQRTLLLRCVAITPRYRNRGFGKAVMERVVVTAQSIAQMHGQSAPHTVVAIIPSGYGAHELIETKMGSYGFVQIPMSTTKELLKSVDSSGDKSGVLVGLGMRLPVDDSADVVATVQMNST